MINAEQTMQAVTKILAVTVMIDKRQRDREMIEFCHAVMTINRHQRPGVILPRQAILRWFETEKPAIETALAKDTDHAFKVELLKQIVEPELCRMVLAAIFTICTCDYEFRDEEADFIKIALDIWKSEMPSSQDLEMIAS